MISKQKINIFWFRRDLRIADNCGLFNALKSELPVLPLFIFDSEILSKLEDADDARVTFIHQTISNLSAEISKQKGSLLVKYGSPQAVWSELIKEYHIQSVFVNHDYEPYGIQRDHAIRILLNTHHISFLSFKDYVIFEKDEILKADQRPYTVFTPYMNKWLDKFKAADMEPYPSGRQLNNFIQTDVERIPTLKEIGFIKSVLQMPVPGLEKIPCYAETRDLPGINGTTLLGVHLRFGTVSIREILREASFSGEKTFLKELIWREFYAMILYQFPETVTNSFKKEYDHIRWRNDEKEYEAWCNGQTGYPMVDAGMRQLNVTGFMHNRVRMITASFLCKHLLIDWRWGERYFARKLLDYELASNIGGWQWAAGCGTDAAPYFRIFNPTLQMKKFDPELKYIKQWVPEYADFSQYPKPIVEHSYARERCLRRFREALNK
jgi:deoxyribodipyrimidine photo-lyase